MKKKIMGFFIVGIFVLSGLSAIVSSAEKIEHEELMLKFSKPVIKEHSNYVTITVAESNNYLLEPRRPIIPVYTHELYFPIGTTIESISFETENVNQQTLIKDIMPAPKPIKTGFNNPDTNYYTTVYIDDEPYPTNLLEYTIGQGLQNGQRCIIVKIQANLVKYYPVDKTMEYYEDIQITVDYTSPESTAFDDEYSLIILTPGKYSSALNSLATHKINRNITTKIVTLNDIYTSTYFPVQGRDDQEKIKYFIKNAYDNWGTTDVMIVGGIDDFPARETHIRIENDQGDDDEEIFVSDLYYADIYGEGDVFCSWDSNSNDVFGEYNWGDDENYDEMDLFPDVRIGRLAATSSTEVNTVVDKIITYETGKAYTQNWFNNIVVIGGDTVPDENSDPDEEDIDEGELLNQAVLDVMDGFIPDIIWDSNKKLSGIAPSGVSNINNGINSGCGFVDWSGHGAPTVWTTYPHNIHRQILPTPYPPGLYYSFYNSDLTNVDKLPIVMCGGCSLGKYQANDECFAWTYLTNPNGGGIASFGASALGYVYLGKWVTYGLVEGFMLDLYEAYDDGAITLGEMWNRAVNNYISGKLESYDYKTLTELHTFGDPTLAISEESLKPNTPNAPTGPSSGETGKTYTFTASTTDPDGDDISYLFDWGDGTYSEWTELVDSGDEASASHSWSSKNSFEIRVKAKDEHGVQSEWSDPLSITMPKNKAINTPFLQFLQQHPHMFPLLRQLLEL